MLTLVGAPEPQPERPIWTTGTSTLTTATAWTNRCPSCGYALGIHPLGCAALGMVVGEIRSKGE